MGNQVSPHPLLCPKRPSVFSPRPLTSFGSPSNRFSFIEPYGSQMKKPTSSCGHFGKVLVKRGNDVFVIVKKIGGWWKSRENRRDW
nr:MAG TPA: hypothetical protein [Caudoviricetes sp.]